MPFGSKHNTSQEVAYVMLMKLALDYTAGTRGRSVKGLPAKKVVCNQTIPRVTILCAFSPTLGMIHHKIIMGGAKQEQFENFIYDLFELDFGQPVVPREGADKRFIIPHYVTEVSKPGWPRQ